MKDDSAQTQRLLQALDAGDEKAVNQLLSRHSSFVRGIVNLRLEDELRGRVDVSDVVQETMVEVARRLDDYLVRRPMSFRLWLHKTTCQNLAKLREKHRDARRRSVRREERLPDRSSMLLARRLVARGATPEQEQHRKDLALKVRDALAEMDAIDRDVLLMRYMEQLSNPEIAYVLDLAPDAVRKRHGRALLKLERILREEGLESDEV